MTPAKIKWNLDDGYPKVFPPDQTTLPFRVMASGETNGLGLDLFLNTSEHQFACDGSSIGFNVSIKQCFAKIGNFTRLLNRPFSCCR